MGRERDRFGIRGGCWRKPGEKGPFSLPDKQIVIFQACYDLIPERPVSESVIAKVTGINQQQRYGSPALHFCPVLSNFQYLPGGVLGVHLLDDAFQNTVLIEDERAPERSLCGFAVHLLLAPDTERLEHFGGGVSQQPEWQFIPGPESGMGLCAIFAHTYYIISGIRQFRIVVPEGTGLRRASGCVILGIEVDDGLLSLAYEILRFHYIPVLVYDLEGRHLVPCFQHIVF